MFFYMPLQHAESRDVQDESVLPPTGDCSPSAPELRGPFAASSRSAGESRAIIERSAAFSP